MTSLGSAGRPGARWQTQDLRTFIRRWTTPASWVLPVIAGLVLRAPGLHQQVLGGDELHAVRAVLSMPLSEILTTNGAADYSIPLAALYWVLSKLTVLSEALLRMPILLSGAIVLIVVPWVLRGEVGRSTAMLLTWMLALSPGLVMYSTLAQPYMPVVLLSFGAAMCFYFWMEQRSWRAGAGYILLAALAAYFHLAAVPFLASPFLFAIASRLLGRTHRRPSLSRLALLAAGLLLAASILIAPASDSLFRMVDIEHSDGTLDLATLTGTAILLSGTTSAALSAAFFGFAAIGASRWLRERRRLAAYTIVLTAGQLAGVWTLAPENFDRPYVFARYLLVLLPFLLAWVAAGLTAPWWPRQSPTGRMAQRFLAFGFVVALFLSGPLADRRYWASSFQHHVDFISFDRPRGTLEAAEVPAGYRMLSRDDGGSAIVEFPWPKAWILGRVFYQYQQFHQRDVIVSASDPGLYDPRLAFDAMVAPSHEALLASRARYVVVHRDVEAEAKRIHGAPRDWSEAQDPQLEALRKAGRAMAIALEARWGRPAHADDVVSVWDLAAIRAKWRGESSDGRVPAAAAEGRPNILLISIDTLRADHLGCYGYARDTSPVLDRLAQDSLRFADAHAPTPWTLPSHASMLTGRDPLELGILDKSGVIPSAVPTLAEALRSHGYHTAAFVDSELDGFVGGRRGFARGFDWFAHSPHEFGGSFEYDMRLTVDASLAWLNERDASRPFFLFLHTKSVHSLPDRESEVRDAPYANPDGYPGRFVPDAKLRFSWREGEFRGTSYLREMNRRLATGRVDKRAFSAPMLAELIALYDGGIYYVDEQIGRLLESLARLDLDENTVVIVTADHGEAFLDHRFFLHQELQHELIQVPLIVHLPGSELRGTVERTVHLEDVAATVMSLAGLNPPPEMVGRTLLSEDADATAARRFTFFRLDKSYGYVAYGLEDGPWLLVYHKSDADREFSSELLPHEGHGPAEPVTAREREVIHGDLLQSLRRHFGPVLELPWEDRPMDDETREELRALGYID